MGDVRRTEATGMDWRDREKYGLIITVALALVGGLVVLLSGGDRGVTCPSRQDAAEVRLVEGDPGMCLSTLRDGRIVQPPVSPK